MPSINTDTVYTVDPSLIIYKAPFGGAWKTRLSQMSRGEVSFDNGQLRGDWDIGRLSLMSNTRWAKDYTQYIETGKDVINDYNWGVLHRSMKESGYIFDGLPGRPIQIAISRDGKLFLVDGRHRLIVAQRLKIPVVPVQIAYYHPLLDSKKLTEYGVFPRPNRVLTEQEFNEAGKLAHGDAWSGWQSRWVYHKAAADLVQKGGYSSPNKVLEIGALGRQIVPGSCTIDKKEGAHRTCKLPIDTLHDITQIPWPFEDKQFEWVIALRVWHRLGEDKKRARAFREARRVGQNLILVVPNKRRDGIGIPPEKFTEWNEGVSPDLILPVDMGPLYFWKAK